MTLLAPLEVLQISSPGTAPPCLRAVDFVGGLAVQSGAKVMLGPGFQSSQHDFSGRGKSVWPGGQTLQQWVQQRPNRILLIAGTPGYFKELLSEPDVAAVEISMEGWHSETTLFAESGLANLLGDPKREPLVPAGHYAAASIGYAGFTALLGVYAKLRQFALSEVAQVNGLAALGWINWKSAAAGALGEEYHREGDQAEWPILPCIDGHVAMVFTERDWDTMLNMINDDGLRDPRFTTFANRQKYRGDYMPIIKKWVADKTKAELTELFYEFGIPAAPVATPADLLNDPLLKYRNAFSETTNAENKTVLTPVAPYRVAAEVPAPAATDTPKKTANNDSVATLPLKGKRILDLGIITAGAGTTGLLADMGAEVIKIETEKYPDPFRMWAGSSDSPLFAFNNRNKFGVAIDLKTPKGKAQFLKLVETADAVVENFRRGVLDRLGITLDVLREVNPKILLASVSGMGLDGPRADHTTFGSTLEASSGFAAHTCYDDGLPYISGRFLNYPDQTVCFYAASMITAGMVHCEETNCSMQIDIAQRDVAMYIIGDVFERISAGGASDIKSVREASSNCEIEGIFRCNDGRWVGLGIYNSADLSVFPDLSAPSVTALAEWTAIRSADEVVTEFREYNLGAAKVLYGSEMYTHPVIREQGVFQKSPTGKLVKGFPFNFRNAQMTIWGDAPKVGEHSDKFLVEE